MGSDFDCLTECIEYSRPLFVRSLSHTSPHQPAKMQLFMCFMTFIASISAQDCPTGYWGDDCNFRCGMCKNESTGLVGCNKENGECLNEKGCEQGYTGKTCQEPLCTFGGTTTCAE